jgi:hypothetical protein
VYELEGNAPPLPRLGWFAPATTLRTELHSPTTSLTPFSTYSWLQAFTDNGIATIDTTSRFRFRFRFHPRLSLDSA